MTRALKLEPIDPRDELLVIHWDKQAGTVTGPGARTILEFAQPGKEVPVHPMPFGWRLGEEPLKSDTDMAAILGWCWKLPEDLRAAYPEPSDEFDPDVIY